MRRRQVRLRPWLEALEDRLAPSCSVTTLDLEGDRRKETLRIVGDDAAQVLNINAKHDRASVDLSCSRGGVHTSYSGITNFDIRLGGGDDDVFFYPSGRFERRTVTASIDLGGGNDYFLMEDASSTMNRSHLKVDVHGGDGNDYLSTDDFPVIQNGSSWEVNLYLGTGNNGTRSNMDTALSGDSDWRLYVEGSPRESDTDNVYVRFNVDAFDTSRVNVDVDLLGGNDHFTGEVHNYYNNYGGTVSMDVDAGEGNDKVNVTGIDPSDRSGKLLRGLTDINLKGGAGADALRVDLRAADGLELDGRLRVRADGGEGADLVAALFKNTAGSVGNYDVTLLGAEQDDLLHVALTTPPAAQLTFNNTTTGTQGILLDGQDGSNGCKVGVSDGVPVLERNCVRVQPIIAVEATDPSASETGREPGTFTFRRSGDTIDPVTVAYTIGGTATAGTNSTGDYLALPGTVTFAAGATTATVKVTPRDDALLEGAETVVVTVTPSSRYAVGAPDSATVSIQDDDLPALTLLAAGAQWKYLDSGTDQGTAWRGAAFNDTAWKSGAAQLGFGDGDEKTVIARGRVTYYFRHSFNVADPSLLTGLKLRLLRDDGAVVYLNGTEVSRSNLPAGTITSRTGASASVDRGDETTFFPISVNPALLVSGANVLAVEVHQRSGSSDLSFDLELLGFEELLVPIVSIAATDRGAAEPGTDSGEFTITRTGDTTAALTVAYDVGGSATDGTDYNALPRTVVIPAGATSATVVVTPKDDPDFEGSETVVLTLAPDSAYLRATENSAAVTLADNESPPGPTTLIATRSTWQYLDKGTNEGTAWRDAGFDDSAWKSGAGPLGYGTTGLGTTVSFGPRSSNKYITTYFRRDFTVANAAAVSSLTLRLRRDDGAVVYLNGVEVARSNMPRGTITYQTQASASTPDPTRYFEFSVDPRLLVSGTNVLAVEVHQSSVGSSDIVFDVGLIAR